MHRVRALFRASALIQIVPDHADATVAARVIAVKRVCGCMREFPPTTFIRASVREFHNASLNRSATLAEVEGLLSRH